MTDAPILSFITINYNGINDTCELIYSIIENIKSINYEIIVVDNASSNNEALSIKKKFPKIIVISSKKNLGFSGGNNEGIKVARGKFLFLINNDTIIKNDIRDFISFIDSNPLIAAASPKIKDFISPYKLQYAGYTKLTPITLRNKTIGLGKTDNKDFNTNKITPYLHGAAILIKKEVIDIIGFMPEIYFLYYEEIDWSTKMSKAGYELWYYSEWCVYHKESQSTGKYSKLKIYYLTRNRLLYTWRNLNGINKWLSILYQIFIAIPKNQFGFLIKRRIDLIICSAKAIFSFIFLTNKMH